MLKMIINHDEIEAGKKDLKNWSADTSMGFDVEFTPDDERYGISEIEQMIVVCVDHNENNKPYFSLIELGIDDSVYDMTNEEVEMIKTQLLEAGLFNY